MITLPTGTAVAGWQSSIDSWAGWLLARWTELTSIWTLAQFGIIAVCALLALLLAHVTTPPLEARLRRIKEQPSLLRLLVIFLRRLRWIYLVILLALVAAVMGEVTWPSRSYFIRVATSLATAWLVVSILSRLIRNRSLANAVAALAWIVAALVITGMLDSTLKVMDSMALTISGFRLSVLMAVKTIILFGVLLWLAATVSAIAEQRIVRVLEIDPTIAVLVGKVLRATLFLIAVFASFSAIGIDLTALAVFSGAIGLGIGFGLQKVASNLISGFIILLDRSIKPGDVISLGSTFGWITELKARYVQVNTRDGIEYLIPNETFITERLANMSHSDRSIRLELKFGVSYDSDPHLVKSLAIDCVTALPRVIAFPVPVCHIVAFGDSSIDFVLRFWIQDPENGMTNVRGDAFLALWDVFKQNGVKIPYPHRDILVRNETGATTLPDSDRPSTRTRMSTVA